MTTAANAIFPEGYFDFHNNATARLRADNFVCWTDPELAEVTVLRLIGDYSTPEWGVSFCHGVLKNGEPCTVQLPFDRLPKRGLKGAIIKEARKAGVFAKGIGLLDEGTYSKVS
jgi:hypothetical protein